MCRTHRNHYCVYNDRTYIIVMEFRGHPKISTIYDNWKCSQGNVMNACRILYSAVVINQPKEDNSNRHLVDKILEESSTRKYINGKVNDKCSRPSSGICTKIWLQWNLLWYASFRSIHLEGCQETGIDSLVGQGHITTLHMILHMVRPSRDPLYIDFFLVR